MPRQYPEEFKKKIVLTYLTGISMSNLCQRFRISQSTFYRWIKEYVPTDRGENFVNPNMLQQRYERLEHILQIIRLSGLIYQASRQKRLEILVRLHEQFEQYSVHELCEALNVSRGTFYNHIFRKVDRTKYFEEQQALMLQVQQVFDDSKQRYGAEKIRAILAKNGIKAGKK